MLNTLNQTSCSNEQKSGETNLFNLETSLSRLKIQSNITYKNERQQIVYRIDENYKMK